MYIYIWETFFIYFWTILPLPVETVDIRRPNDLNFEDGLMKMMTLENGSCPPDGMIKINNRCKVYTYYVHTK